MIIPLEGLNGERYDVRSPWEREISKYSVSDIDKDVFEAYIKRAQKAGRIDFADNSIKSVLSRLDLIEGDRLLNAGAAIFVENGMNEVQMAKFASDERLTFTDIRRYTGSILTLIERTVSYVIDAMDWRVEFDGRLERREIPEIPVNAVREAVTNAFAHRSFESGQSVEISVYRSYIDIYSPGKFPEGLTPEDFITEAISPIRRNPLITRTLYYSKDMESFATGLKRIQEACDKEGCKVEYKTQAYGFTVRFHRHSGSSWCTQDTQNNDLIQVAESRETIQDEVGIQKPEAGTRKPEVGTRKSDVGTRKSDVGTRKSDVGTRKSDVGTRKTDVGTQKPEAGTRKTDVGTRKTDVGTRKPNDITDSDEYRAQIVLMISRNNKISRKEMAGKLSTSERTIQRILNSIPSIHYVGRGKNGHWEMIS